MEGDFFFAPDDPQMQATRRVAERFPTRPQILVRVAGPGLDRAAYRSRLARLTEELAEVDGVDGSFSVLSENPDRSPLFGRILLTPDPAATNVILEIADVDPSVLLPRIEAVVEAHGAGLDVVISGVPAIVEMIRRSLERDLVVFSAAAVVVFTLLMTLIYRDPAVVLGTLATCVASVALTLLVVDALGVGIGLLTANLVTLVFVLSLSHVVFLTGNWRRAVALEGVETTRRSLVVRAVRDTAEPSFWSMVTTLLGFASLLVATARPLRELGLAGGIGAVVALAVAYAAYPAFLGGWARVASSDPAAPGALASGSMPSAPSPSSKDGRSATRFPGDIAVVAAAAAVVVTLGFGISRLNTDPGLLTYFAEGSDLREGLERIDADGGSSTLDVVVEDPEGRSVVSGPVFGRLQELQRDLEADSAVGVVLSPTVLVEHARTFPLAGFLPVRLLLDLASTEALGGVGRSFVSEDRSQARFSLRMREAREEDRRQVLRRIRERVSDAELRPVVVAGLYDLQARLGDLLASSLRIGIGGLLLLFLAVSWAASRSIRVTAAMWLCLASVPVVVLGTFGLAGIALDIITSPAASIALALGADAMIHLVVRARSLDGGDRREVWRRAVSEIRRPVLGATAMVGAGFGIFVLSSFPPTRRFGLAVILGAATAATMALIVLPRLACLLAPRSDSLSAP